VSRQRTLDEAVVVPGRDGLLVDFRYHHGIRHVDVFSGRELLGALVEGGQAGLVRVVRLL
jgi:hypothetical protein